MTDNYDLQAILRLAAEDPEFAAASSEDFAQAADYIDSLEVVYEAAKKYDATAGSDYDQYKALQDAIDAVQTRRSQND